MQTLSLDGMWKLYRSTEKGGKHEPLHDAHYKKWACIDAIVPGNVELDLVKAGIEPDPFIADHIHRFRKYEYNQWVYEKHVYVPSDFSTQRIFLQFDGIDTVSDIYMNDRLLGQASNMFIEHRFDVTDVLKKGEQNHILVHIHSAMNEARSHSYTMAMRGTARRNEICWIRKAPHCFGWDIAPRLLSAGLWRGVFLSGEQNTRLTETYYAVSSLLEDGSCELQIGYRFTTDLDTLDDFGIRIHAKCGNSQFSYDAKAHFISGNHTITVQNPNLWWPYGYGEPHLYTITMELLHQNRVIDAKTERIGLRTCKLVRDFTSGKQTFQVWINDVRIFAKGTNWVPLDALHSRDAGRLHRAHDLVKDVGTNMIRCWGGNVIEDHAFFDLCDERGIMVWQDFSMGNTNYPQTEDFFHTIEHEASMIVKKLRNHVSLTLWSGDNEVDFKNMGYAYPHEDARYNRITRELLPKVIQAHDPYRFFIRSSPEIPEGFHTDDIPEQHTWGVRAYFKDDFYKHSTASFISEAGYHGCPSVSSLKKFIPEDCIWPFENDMWAIHSTEDITIEKEKNGRNRLMAEQVKILFGHIPNDPYDFSLLSQISQAEALKFFIERSRCKKWARTGILWWNMLDCWPQISDAVVDYYFEKKVAYHYIKRVQKPVLLMMDELQGRSRRIILSNDTRTDQIISYQVTLPEIKKTVAKGTSCVPAGENAVVSIITETPGEQCFYVLTWTDANGITHGNHYIAGYPPFDANLMRKRLEHICSLPEPFVMTR